MAADPQAELDRLRVQLALAQVEIQRLATALKVPVTCPTCRTRFAREPLAEDAAALGRNARGE